MDAICRWLEECRILAKTLTWLPVAVYGFQGFRADIRELVGSNANNRTVLLVELLEMRHKGSREHPFEIWEPRSCDELWSGVIFQRMEVKIVEDIPNAVSYGLVASLSAFAREKLTRIDLGDSD